jgi:hypothetical protein
VNRLAALQTWAELASIKNWHLDLNPAIVALKHQLRRLDSGIRRARALPFIAADS